MIDYDTPSEFTKFSNDVYHYHYRRRSRYNKTSARNIY